MLHGNEYYFEVAVRTYEQEQARTLHLRQHRSALQEDTDTLAVRVGEWMIWTGSRLKSRYGRLDMPVAQTTAVES